MSYKVWTPADLREEYFRLYGFGEWTTLRVLIAAEGLVSQAERALRQLAKQDRRVELYTSPVGNVYVRIHRA